MLLSFINRLLLGQTLLFAPNLGIAKHTKNN